MPRLAAFVATAWLLLTIGGAITSVARAQQGEVGAPGGVIQEIEVQGNQRIEAATVRSYLAVAVGDPFDPVELDRSLKNLFATGLFDDVSLRREGDRLIVAVVENPIINRIAFEGNRRLDDETLEAELQLRPRVVYTRSRVQNAVSRILELYRRNGRFAATVEPKVIELPQNRVDLVFEINEGPLTKVARIVFIGNQAFDDDDLRSVIQTKEAAWYRFLSSDDTYDPDRVAFDQELLRRYYLARGYADFNVRSAIAELTPDGERFVVTFTVEEGERYDFGKIGIESRIPDLEPEQLRELLKTKQGDVYNADQIEDSISALTEEIGELGYAFAQVEPVPNKHEAEHTIDLTYAINEGSRVYIERIDIVGNVRTLDEVIRREFRVSEGDAFNTALLRRSRQRIENLGYFEKVEINTLPGSSPDKTRIEVNVSERSTGELSFGAGYSTSDGPLGDIRLTERNFLGRGQSIQANFTISGRTQEIDLGFTEPYFLDREVAAGFDLFRRSTNFQSEGSFDQRTTGGTLRANYPLTERWRHGLRLTVREDVIHNVDNDASQFIQDEEGNALTVLLGQDLTYDTRDTRFLPSDGYIVTAQPGRRRFWRRHAVPARRGAWFLLLSVLPRLGAQCGRTRRLHLWPGRGCPPVRSLLPRRRDVPGLQVRRRRAPRHLHRRCPRRQSIVHRHARATLPLGFAGGAQDFWQGVRRGRQSGRSRCQRADRVRQQCAPGLGRRRPVLAVAAWPDQHRSGAGLPEGG